MIWVGAQVVPVARARVCVLRWYQWRARARVFVCVCVCVSVVVTTETLRI